MAEPKKDTIYIDIDDEITGIIDKVRDSKGKVTALVLPKRAGVFQSIVNMKLLKRAADEADKNLVLITSEAGLLPLAGAAGIHVAKTLSSKPEIPMAPKLEDAGEEAIDEAGNAQPITKDTAGDQPVGQLAAPPTDNGVETLQLDDDELPNDEAADASKSPLGKKPVAVAAAAKNAKDKGKKGGKVSKIPNFGKFRKKLIFAGIILLLLIIGMIAAIIVLPKATINIKTDAQNVPVSLNLNLSTAQNELDDSSDTPTLPAKLASVQKTYSQQVPSTGQKNNGSKATGSIMMTAQECGSSNPPSSVPAGTGVTANGNTYITQQTTTFSSSGKFEHGCITVPANSSTPIKAQAGGSSYNTGNGSTFSIAGHSDVSATGSASGGTDNVVQVVNQNDISNAKSKISTNDNTQKDYLVNQLKQDGYFAIKSTFSSGTPNMTQSAQVDDVANNVTVTETITYTMFGAKEKDLDTIVDNSVKNQVNTSKQSILDRGLSNAAFGVNSSNGSSAQLTLQTTAEVGPDLDTNAIRQAALGKKPADVRSEVGNNPDVKSVDVNLSPFWVGSVPKKASKVTVKIAKPAATKSSSNANDSQ